MKNLIEFLIKQNLIFRQKAGDKLKKTCEL